MGLVKGMSKATLDKWIRALRSGKYVQGREFLKNEDGYCCLGVLAEVCPRKVKSGGDDEYWTVNDDPNCPLPVDEYLNEIGLSETTANRLASLNDDGVSFDTIANYLETRYNNLLELPEDKRSEYNDMETIKALEDAVKEKETCNCCDDEGVHV